MTKRQAIKSGSVTQASMRLSAADGQAFVDFGVSGLFDDHIGALLRIYDSAGKKVEGYIEALGTGETYGANQLDNASFETAGANPPVFQDWTQTTSWGFSTISRVSTPAAQDGTYHCKFYNFATQVRVLQNKPATALKLYKVGGYAHGSGTYSPRYSIYDDNSSAYIITAASVGVTAAAWTAFSKYATALAVSTNWIVSFWCSLENATTYFDNVNFVEVLTPSATGVTIVSELDGSTQNWASQESGFNYNDSGYTFEICYRYADKEAALSRTPCTLAVLTMDFCAETFGALPCLAGTNLVTNGDMELDSNWTAVGAPTESQTGSYYKDGSFSWYVVPDSNNEGIQSDDFTTETGNLYLGSLWVLSLETSVTIKVRSGDDSGFVYNETHTIVDGEWVQVTFEYIETSGGSGAYIQLLGPLAAGTYFFDAVRIVEASGACYNTYPTCQYPSAFSGTTREYKFSSHEAPLPFEENERPYIGSVSYLSTEIRDSETVKGRITLELTDEPDTDVGIDPYVAGRASVQGTFWKKFLARNRNYKGRKVKLYDGFIGLAEEDYTTYGKRFYGIIDNIKIGKGRVSIEAADLLKQLDETEIPAKVNIRLAADATAIATQITVEGSGVADMESTGYLRVDDEIVYYGAVDTGTGVVSSITRSQFETEAATHDDGAKVQPVKYYEADNPFDMLQAILADASVDGGDIDTAAFDAEKAFFADLDIEAVISEPTSAQDLYFELVDLMACKSWVSEDLKITIARILPNHPDRAYSVLTDALNILAESASVDLNQASQVTRCSVFWDPQDAEAQNEQASYRRLTIAVDAEAESASEYNTQAEKKILSRWLRHSTPGSTEEEQDVWINSLAGRNVWQFRDPMPVITLEIEIKDGRILTGQFVSLSTDELQNPDGSDLALVSFQVVSREKLDKNRVRLKCLRLTSRRICYVADDGAPDFSSATAAEKEIYGYVCGDDGHMADFTDGYYIF